MWLVSVERNAVASRIGLTNNGDVMSVSMLQPGNSWQDVPIPIPMRIGDEVFSQTPSLDELARPEIFIDSGMFHGSLLIQPGGTLRQDFRLSVTGNAVTFENIPSDSWPKLSVELVTDSPSGRLRLKEVFIRPWDQTVKGRLLYTRLLFLINRAGGCSIHSEALKKPFDLRLPLLSAPEEMDILYGAKVYRKLKYIESYFNKRFLLPAEISGEEVSQIERIFRGITEGEFVTRNLEVVLEFLPSDLDLTAPPFSEPGNLSFNLRDEMLFDQVLDIGPIEVVLKDAEIADSRVIDEARKNISQPIDIRFMLYDPRVFYRFENFARQPRQALRQQLDTFKQMLAQYEPRELVDLIDESLQNDVSSDEAVQIAVGWQFYNHLPDRYCPQEPVLDEVNNCWRVPIYLVYTGGEGGLVGELVIDLKTGEIIEHTPVEELRSRGLALAEKILHAR